MSQFLRYVLVDADDNEGGFEYSDREEALRHAENEGKALVMRPDGGDFWPPQFTENDRLGRAEA